MANELNTTLALSGKTVTAQLFFGGTSVGSAITCTEVGTSKFYSGDMPGGLDPKTYQVVFYESTIPVSSGTIAWDGTAEVQLTDVAPAVWDEVLTGATHNVNASAGKRLRQLGDERIITEGATQGATSDTITLEAIGTLCVGQTIVVTDQSTGDKQTRYILAYDAGTNTATVDSPWCSTPTAGDAYLITTVRDPLIIRASHPEGTVGAEIDELYLIHGLKSGSALTVTPTSRAAGSVSQTIGGDGTTTTTVTRA